MQQAFIVLLQPEEGVGVAADDIDQAAAGFQCEGGRGGGGLNQLQGVCELVGILLQALLVEKAPNIVAVNLSSVVAYLSYLNFIRYSRCGGSTLAL